MEGAPITCTAHPKLFYAMGSCILSPIKDTGRQRCHQVRKCTGDDARTDRTFYGDPADHCRIDDGTDTAGTVRCRHRRSPDNGMVGIDRPTVTLSIFR